MDYIEMRLNKIHSKNKMDRLVWLNNLTGIWYNPESWICGNWRCFWL
jgi:hypothetical protein